jgi:hypothetical protein
MLRIESLQTEGNNVIRYICSIRVYKSREITLFGVHVRRGITQCVCAKGSNYTCPVGLSVFKGK